MIEESLTPFAAFIREFGFPVFVVIALIILTYMVLRTRNKAQDAQTEIQNNANNAQEMINKRVAKLEDQNADQAKSIDKLQTDLAAAKWELDNARREIVGLQQQLVAMEADKSALATERDKLRSELDTAKLKIQDLERDMFKLQAKLDAEQNVRETVVDPLLKLLKEALPPRVSDAPKAPDDAAVPNQLSGGAA